MKPAAGPTSIGSRKATTVPTAPAHRLRMLWPGLLALLLCAPAVGAAARRSALPPPPRPTAKPRPRPAATARPTPPSTLRLFVGPGATVWPFVHGIEEARRRVLLQVGTVSDPRLLRVLLRAKSRGVDVRLLYDAALMDPGALDVLRAGGVLVRSAGVGYAALAQTTLVVDGYYALLSTAMLTPYALDRVRGFVLRDLDRPAAAQVAAVFYDDWLRRGHATFVPHLILGPDTTQATVLHVADLAQHSLDIYTREVDDPATTAALLAIQGRGVAVRVLTSGDAGWGSDVRLVVGTVAVRRLAAPAVRGTVIIQDGQRAYLSGHDLSTGGLATSRTVGVMLHEHAIVRRLSDVFSGDWARATIVRKPPPPTATPLPVRRRPPGRAPRPTPTPARRP